MSFESDLPPALRALKAVCRCNNIKYKTIDKTIRDGAKTVREVAAKTRATTGYCGGTCTPEIQQMIDAVHSPKPAVVAAAEPEEWWVRKK